MPLSRWICRAAITPTNSGFLTNFEGSSRGLTEAADLQFHSFTGLWGGGVLIPAPLIVCKSLEIMRIWARSRKCKRSIRALLGGQKRPERIRIASGAPGSA